MKQKGFTLIELLAVIVILAIIALIATPIVLNIIKDSKESANLQSAQFYMGAVENAVAKSMLNNKPLQDGTYNIIEDGNICIQFELDKVRCKDVLKVDVSGEVPTKGSTIIVIDGQIKSVNLKYEQSTIMKNQKGDIEFFKNEYKIGDPIVFNPGDGEKTWNVISEDIDTVTLLLSQNLGELVNWYSIDNNNYGPIEALTYLNTLTTNWTNVDLLDNYIYINNYKGTTPPYGYQKILIKNGITTITSQMGDENQVLGETKARILTLEEAMEIGQQFNENLKEENLREYLERNLGTISSIVGITFKTVDECIDTIASVPEYVISYSSKYMQTYFIVRELINNYQIDTTYDIKLPDFLCQNLDTNEKYQGYWLLTTMYTLETNALYLSSSKTIRDGSVYYEGLYYRGVRPIITIPKSKLK